MLAAAIRTMQPPPDAKDGSLHWVQFRLRSGLSQPPEVWRWTRRGWLRHGFTAHTSPAAAGGMDWHYLAPAIAPAESP